MDKDKNFYFLEMNTRLQVEHPVTEEVTGIDLVEQMIRVANGEKLALAQGDVKLNGWAMESRVYAEDPARGFLPSIGRLVRYIQPDDQEGVRVDTGVYEGAEISMFYDPMIAKLVTYGKDRTEAIGRMKTALNRYYVRGVQHNMDFLNDLMSHPRFVEGRLTTNFMAEEYPDGYDGGVAQGEALEVIVAVAGVMHRREQERAARISGQLLHGAPPLPHDWIVQIDRDYHEVGLEGRDGAYAVTYGGETKTLESDWQPGDVLFSGTYGGREIDVQADRAGVKFRLAFDGLRTDVLVLSPRQAELAARMPIKEKPDLSGFLLSPMPGLLVRVAVEIGQDVKAGEELAVVEAMKMENVLRAERDGVVKAIPVEPGDNLAVDQVIIEFE
jgi:propionyl-CoA carboxylase alpha chain